MYPELISAASYSTFASSSVSESGSSFTLSSSSLIAGWFGLISTIFFEFEYGLEDCEEYACALLIRSMFAEWPDSDDTTTIGSCTSRCETITESTVSEHSFLHQSVRGWNTFLIFLNFLRLRSSSSGSLKSPLPTFTNFFFSYSFKCWNANSSTGSSRSSTSYPFFKSPSMTGDFMRLSLDSPAMK